jgi:hypothetical protein
MFAGFVHTIKLASYEALPGSPFCLYSPVFFSPVVLCLPSDAVRRFFKVLSIQYLNVKNGDIRSLTYSVGVAEVTRVNSISVSPIHAPGFPGP